jgi:hypothetical protein
MRKMSRVNLAISLPRKRKELVICEITEDVGLKVKR